MPPNLNEDEFVSCPPVFIGQKMTEEREGKPYAILLEPLAKDQIGMVARITAAINTFTKWVEANKGLVTSIAATVASIGVFGAAMFTVGTASRVLSAGVGVVSTPQ